MPSSKSRRRALRWLAATVAAPAAAAAGAQAPPSISLRDLVRMRGALDDRLVVGHLVGRYYAVIDGEIAPLFGVISATFSRWRAHPEGGFLVASYEHAYYTDIAATAAMASWQNPLNGRSVDVPVWTSEPAQRIFTPALAFEPVKPTAAGSAIEHRMVAADERGGDRIVVEQVRFVARPPPPARPYRYAELVTLRARSDALKSGDTPRVPCETAFSSVSSWRPWMAMGDAPGHLLCHGAGAYGTAMDALPAAWIDATRRLRPELLRDPGKRLA